MTTPETPASNSQPSSSADPSPTRGTNSRRGLGGVLSGRRLITLALLGLISVFSVHLIDRWLDGMRLDLTQDSIYSLSHGSKAVLERMRTEGVKPVTATLYFSETTGKTLPSFIKEFISYQRYLRSLLSEYQRSSDGKLKVRFVDPAPDSDEAQRAADFGLDGKVINQEGDLFYFGLTFETQTGSRQAIPFLWPAEQETVEYEISKTLYRLLWPNRDHVGVISSLDVFGSADDPYMAQIMAAQGRQPTPKWITMQLLEELYDVEKLGTDVDEIPNDSYDLLVIIHPKNLPTKTLSAIDAYVQRGGNTLVLVDPYSIADQPPQNPQQPWAALQYRPSSNLEPLFSAWGIDVPADTFAGDYDLAVRRPVQARGRAESVVVDLNVDATQHEETLDTKQPLMRGLKDLRFIMSGVLEQKATPADDASGDQSSEDAAGDEGAADATKTSRDGESAAAADAAASKTEGQALEIEPLVSTTDQGGRLKISPGFGGESGLAYTDLNSPAKMLDALQPTGVQHIAYLLRGRFPSAYPTGVDYPSKEPERPPGLPPGVDVPTPDDAEVVHRDPVPEEERKDAAVIVFSDVDFITDALAFVQSPFGIAQAANDNHRLFLNAADFLLGSDELMAIRAGKTINRPFTLFDRIESAAEHETLDREQKLRDEVASFEDQLREKQAGITSRNASLLQRKVQEEVSELNRKIADANGELREIRQGRRRTLESEESKVRFSVMGWMPLLVSIFGLVFAYRRKIGGD